MSGFFLGLQKVLPQHGLSRLVGWLAQSQIPVRVGVLEIDIRLESAGVEGQGTFLSSIVTANHDEIFGEREVDKQLRNCLVQETD